MALSAERTRMSDRSSSPLLARTSVRLGLACVLYTAAAVLWLSPLLGSLTSALLDRPNRGDAANYIRAAWGMQHAGSTPFTFTRDTLNGAPEGLPQTPAPAILSPVQPLFTWLLSPLFGLIGSLNLFLLVGYAATGLATFAFLDRLRFGLLPSLFGGYVVAFNAWTLDRAIEGAPAFVHGWCLILLAWALVRLRRDGSPRNAAIAGATYALCFLVAAYFGLLGAALVAAYIVAELLSDRSRAAIAATARRVGVMAGVTAVPLLPALAYFISDYSNAARQLNNPIIETARFAAQPFASYLLPSPHHPVLASLGGSGGGSLSEKSFFVGYTTIALALYALILFARRRLPLREPARLAVTLAAIALPIAYISSLPRIVHIGGVSVPTTAWFVGHVTTFYRVYARFGFVVGIALAILAAAGLSALAKRPRGPLLVVGLFAVLIFELLPGGIHPVAANTVPAYDRWLASQPRGIVAHYPMPTDSFTALKLAGSEYQRTRFTGQPLFTEFGAGIGETREQAIRILTRYIEDPGTVPILAAEGVRYVVVHDALYRAEGRHAPAVPAVYHLVRAFPGVRIYVLPAGTPPADVDQVLEQRAAEVASVEGLAKPSVSFSAAFHLVAKTGNGAGWHTLTGPGRLTFQNHDPLRLKRLSWTLDAMASGKPRTLELVDRSGHVRQTVAVGTTLTAIQLGPFPIGPRSTTYVLRTRDRASKGWDVVLSPGVLQPLADYAVSLRG